MNGQLREKRPMTSVEYLEIDRASDEKYEFFDGEMFAMMGAKKNHNLINTNISRELGNRFIADNSSCRVFSNDMRVSVQKNKKYTYPDLVVA